MTHAQTIITQWKFTTTAGAGDNTPAPTFGVGSASMLGMTNSYVYTNGTVVAGTGNGSTLGTGATASGDIDSSPGVANITQVEDTWRIRGIKAGTNTGSANNGWSLSAPEYSQGAEFDVSTVGYTDITLTFDWYSTNQGIRDLQEEYTLDGSTWNLINAPLVAVPNDYNFTTSGANVIDLSAISGASDDSTFGIRLVSAYDPTYTGAGGPTYTSATLSSGSSVQYNNNSGNWRFANITVDGTAIAVPEPGTTGIFTGGVALLAGLFAAFRRRKSEAAPVPVA